jgi:hypothetical protein
MDTTGPHHQDTAIALKSNEIKYQLIPERRKREIEDRMKEINMFQVKTLAEKIYLLQGEPKVIGHKNKYLLTFEECEAIFGLPPNHAQKLYQKGKKRQILGEDFSNGRPRKLTKIQESQVIKYILDAQDNGDPVEGHDIVTFCQKRV